MSTGTGCPSNNETLHNAQAALGERVKTSMEARQEEAEKEGKKETYKVLMQLCVRNLPKGKDLSFRKQVFVPVSHL